MKRFREFIAESASLPKDVILDLPRISICADKEIFIENHKGILEYTDLSLRIRMNDGIINISGKGLRIVIMRDDRMVINGEFECVEYEKFGRKSKNVQKNL